MTVAREIELEDPVENAAVAITRDAAERTNKSAGDGTTTAVVLARAIATEGFKGIGAGLDLQSIRRGIARAAAAADRYLEHASRPVQDASEMIAVALLASNGDRPLALLVAEAFESIGRDGIVTVEKSESAESRLDKAAGLRFERGYVSPYLVTDPQSNTCEFENARVLLLAGAITRVQPLLGLLESAAEEQVPLLIVADEIESEALAALIVNSRRGELEVAAVRSPEFGEQRKALMADIAILTGTQVFSAADGGLIGTARLSDLGRARRILVSSASTLIAGAAGEPGPIESRRAALRAELEGAATPAERRQIEHRLAALAGGVAALRVGGATPSAVAESADRAEDAVNAARAALAEGILPGGGVALLSAARELKCLQADNIAERFAIDAVARALEAPTRQIAENAGIAGSVAIAELGRRDDPNRGLDVRTAEIVDTLATGIIDPALVVRTALRDASSATRLLLSAEVVVTTSGTAEGVTDRANGNA